MSSQMKKSFLNWIYWGHSRRIRLRKRMEIYIHMYMYMYTENYTLIKTRIVANCITLKLRIRRMTNQNENKKENNWMRCLIIKWRKMYFFITLHLRDYSRKKSEKAHKHYVWNMQNINRRYVHDYTYICICMGS